MEIEQGTPEWHQARLGRVTASRIGDMMAKTRSGWGASRKNYMAEKIAETLTGCAADSYVNAAMQWGTSTEPEARFAYAFMQGVEVEEVGFVPHPKLFAGASPDGLVGTSGMVEIKCPNTATHIDTLLGKTIDRKYVLQMQFQMACTGRGWCDWVSYDPRLPVDMELFIQRVEADRDLIAEIEAATVEFLAEMNEKLERLRHAK